MTNDNRDCYTKFSSRWIDQCAGAHDKNRNIPAYKESPGVGQNWANRMNSVPWKDRNYASMVKGWYDEVWL